MSAKTLMGIIVVLVGIGAVLYFTGVFEGEPEPEPAPTEEQAPEAGDDAGEAEGATDEAEEPAASEDAPAQDEPTAGEDAPAEEPATTEEAPAEGTDESTAPTVDDAVEEAEQAVEDAVEEVEETVEETVEQVEEAVGDAVEDLQEAVEGTTDGAVEDAAGEVEGAAEDAQEAVEGATEGAADQVEGATDQVEGAVEDALEQLEDAADEAAPATDAPAEDAAPAGDGEAAEEPAPGDESRILPEDSVLQLASATAVAQSGWQSDLTDFDRPIGNPDAPVTVIEYASFTCGHCASFHESTWPAFRERFVDSGEIQFVFRHFPLDQLALSASMLTHCVPEARYESTIEVLFATQSDWVSADDPVAALRNIGQLAGLPANEVDACFQDEELALEIVGQRSHAEETYDVSATPSFVINGELVVGNRPLDDFANLIESAAGEPG